MNFIQNAPEVIHPVKEEFYIDLLLRWLVKNDSTREAIYSDLENFGDRLLDEAEDWALDAESHPPTHIPYSPYGERIDEITVSEGWKKLDALSAEEGLIEIGYNRKKNHPGRIHQFLKLYLFHPSSAFYTCPLAMTDGAAKLIEVLKSSGITNPQLENAFDHLTSRDPDYFWTSGQWMTEKTGGSDVGLSETVAKKIKGDNYELYGTKWFTSATTSQMCFTLARITDDNGNYVKGSRGLSLFYVELRDQQNKLKNIEVRRLKDKLGTKALPTAEIDFKGTPALLIGNIGEGIKSISHLFNVTRIYNAVTTVGSFRRLLQLADDYAAKRFAFGAYLKDQPLHKKMLEEAHVAFRGCLLLTFYTVSLLQKEESLAQNGKEDQRNSKLLRLFTPLAKLYTAKVNMKWTSELVESFGGAGYIEDTGIPKFLRDSQVFSIWEGTTNVLSLDCLRAIQKENALEAYLNEVQSLLFQVKDPEAKNQLQKKLSEIQTKAETYGEDALSWEYNARDFSFSLCDLMIGILKQLVF